MKSKPSLWRIIAKSLGEKSGKNNQEADQIALVRLLMFLSIFITNFFIIVGVIVNITSIIKHWDNITISKKELMDSLRTGTHTSCRSY